MYYNRNHTILFNDIQDFVTKYDVKIEIDSSPLFIHSFTINIYFNRKRFRPFLLYYVDLVSKLILINAFIDLHSSSHNLISCNYYTYNSLVLDDINWWWWLFKVLDLDHTMYIYISISPRGTIFCEPLFCRRKFIVGPVTTNCWDGGGVYT